MPPSTFSFEHVDVKDSASFFGTNFYHEFYELDQNENRLSVKSVFRKFHG